MKKNHLDVISRNDYSAFREARKIISIEFGERLSLLDADVRDRINGYAQLSDNMRLAAISEELAANNTWGDTVRIVKKLAPGLVQVAA